MTSTEQEKNNYLDSLFPETDIVKETIRVIKPFDLSLYEIIKKEEPKLFTEIENKFIEINNEFENQRYKFLEKVTKELTCLRINIPTKQEVKKIFDEPFYIRNHMFSVTIEANVGSAKIKFPLLELSKKIKNAFFIPSKTPSMVIFIDNVFCCVIFTYNGNINFVGGYTEIEVKYALMKFMTMLNLAMKELYENYRVTIKSIILQNRVVTTKLCLKKIDTFNLSDYLRELKIPNEYLPKGQDLLKLLPLPKTAPSIRIRLYPSGGIVGTGFKALHEIKTICFIIIPLINKFIRVSDFFISNASIKLWKDTINAQRTRQERNKIRRKAATILKWNNTLNIKSNEKNKKH